MIPLLLIFLPFAFAAATMLCRRCIKMARRLLIACGVVNFLLVLTAYVLRNQLDMKTSLLQLSFDDPIQSTILFVTSLLFLVIALHAWKWLPAELSDETFPIEQAIIPANIFHGLTCAFLGSMMLVILSSNFGLLWVAIEATTLLSAPLIVFRRSAESIEAMWKYMLICSVGIGFALFGTMLMAHASQPAIGEGAGLNFDAIKQVSEQMNPVWFKAAFVFVLAGYGSKMGLAPFHTWLPDAYSAAPTISTALISSSLVNCAFIAITRFRAIAPSVLIPFCNELMNALGLLSLATAAIFIVRQHDFKRMLAYSSVEHMGLVLILFALGSEYLPVHIFFHSVLKMTLFLIAGNIMLTYRSRSVNAIHGMFSKRPWLAAQWVIGILLICGTPPSPLFITEFALISKAGLALGGTVLLLLFIIFCGMSRIMISMTMGQSPDSATEPRQIPASLHAAPLLALAVTLILGLLAFAYA